MALVPIWRFAVLVWFRPINDAATAAPTPNSFHLHSQTLRYLLSRHEGVVGSQERNQDGNGFAEACHNVAEEFKSVSMGTCECLLPTNTILCEIPPVCQAIVNCGRKICTGYTIQSVMSKKDGVRNQDNDSYEVSSVDVWAHYRGSSYQGERAFNNGTICRQWFMIKGVAYACQSCAPCGNGSTELDCSNIQHGAVRSGCDSDMDPFFFDYCPVGGAPDPTPPRLPAPPMGRDNDTKEPSGFFATKAMTGVAWLVVVAMTLVLL